MVIKLLLILETYSTSKKFNIVNSISANLNIMIKASEKASKTLIRDFGELEKLQVSNKGPSDFVTNSDIKTERIIIEELKKARPHYSIISEENGIEITASDFSTRELAAIPEKILIKLSSNKSDCFFKIFFETK